MLDFDSPLTLVLFSFVWFALLAGFVFLIDYFTACFRRWTSFTALVPLLLIHHGISVPFVIDAAYDAQGISPSSYLSGWLGMLITMYVFLLLGAALIGKVYPRTDSIEFGLQRNFRGVALTPLLILFLVAFVGVAVQLASSPWIVSLGDFLTASVSAENYWEQRREFAESTSGLKGIWNYFLFASLHSVVPIVLFLSYLGRRANPAFRVILFSTLLLTILRAVLTGHKANLIITLCALATVHFFARHEGRLRISAVELFSLLALLLILIPLLIYLQYAELFSSYVDAGLVSTYMESIQTGIYRLMVEPNRALQVYAYAYPDVFEHLYGGSSRVFSAFIGSDEAFIPPHTLLPLMWGFLDVTWNVVFIGDAWADFGIVGVAAQSFIVGAMLKGIDEFFWNKSKRGWFDIAVLFAVMYSALRLAFGGLWTVLFGFGLVPCLFIWFLATRSHTPIASNAKVNYLKN